MSRHYSAKHFFRQMPNALLSRFFLERNLLIDFDFSGMKEANPDNLFAAWLALRDDQRSGMDAEFQEIFDMSCEKGFVAIVDEVSWQLRANREELRATVNALSELPNHYHRAMVAYLDHQNLWKGATRFYHADTLPYWRKRKNMGHKPAAVDQASIQQLADLIRDYFHHTEGRGNNCIVECFRRGDKDYFFAYPEDYSQQSIEWVNGEFDRRPHNPAFEVVYVYAQSEGSLDLNFRGSKNAVVPLQAMFSSALLKQENLPNDPKDLRVYDLNPIADKGFEFVFDQKSDITNVRVKKIRLSSKSLSGDRITLEADAKRDPDAIYELLEKIGKSAPLEQYNVTQVELIASIIIDPEKPEKLVTIRLTHPNSCSLKYDRRDLKLRDMLHASKIEPREEVGEGWPFD